MSLGPPEPEAASGDTNGEISAALQVQSVSHSYGKRKALDNVSFQVRPASFCVLLGLNGAGKTTLFSLVTRLYAAQQGTLRICGFDVNRTPGEALRRLGVVFQARTLDLDLTVLQNLSYHAALHGMTAQETKLHTAAVLDQVSMADRANDKARTLSGGQMRRVEIARALLHRPRMLLLDEPTVGLDVKARADILKHVRSLVTRTSIGVLWATHLIDEIQPGDDAVLLHEGRDFRSRPSLGDRHPRRCSRHWLGLQETDRHCWRGGIMATAIIVEPKGQGFGFLQYARCFKWHCLARGAAVLAPEGAVCFSAGAAARLAVHLRGGISLSARRVDHSALRHLRAL